MFAQGLDTPMIGYLIITVLGSENFYLQLVLFHQNIPQSFSTNLVHRTGESP